MEAAVAIRAVEKKSSHAVLMPDHIGLAEHKRNDFVVDLPHGLTLEDAMEPSFWAHVVMDRDMQPLDRVEIRAEDGSWTADLIVAYCERNYAKLKLIAKHELAADTVAPESSIKHEVVWKGPSLKFCVIRKSDSQIIHQGDKEKQTAISWMVEHEKTVK